MKWFVSVFVQRREERRAVYWGFLLPTAEEGVGDREDPDEPVRRDADDVQGSTRTPPQARPRLPRRHLRRTVQDGMQTLSLCVHVFYVLK